MSWTVKNNDKAACVSNGKLLSAIILKFMRGGGGFPLINTGVFPKGLSFTYCIKPSRHEEKEVTQRNEGGGGVNQTPPFKSI